MWVLWTKGHSRDPGAKDRRSLGPNAGETSDQPWTVMRERERERDISTLFRALGGRGRGSVSASKT